MNTLRELRKERGLSQQQMADLLKVNQTAVSQWERGITLPSARVLVRLQELFGVNPSDILTGSDIPSLQNEKDDCFSSDKIIEVPPQKKPVPDISEDALKLAENYDKLNEDLKSAFRLFMDSVLPKGAKKAALYAGPRMNLDPEPEPEEPLVLYVTSRFYTPMSAGLGIEAGDGLGESCMLLKQPPRGTSYVAPISGDSMEPTFHSGDELFVHVTPDIETGQIGVFLMDGKQWVKELGDGVLISHNKNYPPIPMTEDIRCQGLVLGVCDPDYFA